MLRHQADEASDHDRNQERHRSPKASLTRDSIRIATIQTQIKHVLMTLGLYQWRAIPPKAPYHNGIQHPLILRPLTSSAILSRYASGITARFGREDFSIRSGNLPLADKR
jgi:hypothetical protein